MSLTIPAKDLSAALSLVLSATERKGTIPILSYVLVEGSKGVVKLTATDIDSTLQTELTAECDDFAWCVPGAKLAALVQLISGDINLIESKGRILAKSGHTEHRLPFQPREAFPAIESAPNRLGSLSGPLFAQLLLTALIATETNPDGPGWWLNLELIAKDGKLTVTGCSNARVSSVAVDFSGEFEANIPLRASRILATFAETAESVEIACSNNLLSLYSSTGAAHSRLSNLKMAEWRILVSPAYEYAIELNPETVLPPLKRALLASDSGAVSISLSKSEAILTATDNDAQREGREIASITSNLNGSTYDLRLMGEQVVDYLKLCKSSVVWQINANNSAMMFRLKENADFQWDYIQTTLRVR